MEYKKVALCENVEEMFIGPFGSSLKNECFVDKEQAYCMVYEQKHAIQKTMRVETRYVDEKKYKELQRFNVKGGDIIVSCRGTIGETFVIPEDAPLGIMHPSIMKIRLKDGVYDKYYFNSLLKMRLKKHETEANGSGIKMAISATELGKELFPVPSLAEQEQIKNTLSEVEKLINTRREELRLLDNLIKARFVELFGDPMTNSNGYVLKTYGELFELNAGGTPSKQKSEYWDNGTISWIGSNMCQNAVIYENDGNYITVEGLNHSSARMFPIDTVLIALVGATIGKTALLKFETTTNQNVLGVRGIRESGYTPEFIFYYTQGLYQKFLNIGDGGFAMASKGFISELPVPIVELELQEQFTAFAHQVDKSKLQSKNKSLDEGKSKK